MVACIAISSALGACTEPAQRSQVHVTIDADDAVRAMIDEVQATLESQRALGGWEVRDAPRFEPNAQHTWPLEFTIEAKAGDRDSAFQLTATALDTRNAVVGQARAVREFGGGYRLVLRVLFEASCLRRECASGQTCHAGECVDAHYDGRDLVRSAGGAPDAGEPQRGMSEGVVREGDSCTREGARGCAPPPARVPVVCDGSTWKAQPQCTDDEMCDESRGECRPIAHECEARAPNVEFCDQDEMRVCVSKFFSEVRPCGSNKVCISPDKQVMCACRNGFIDLGTGTGCQEATDCKIANGGCDPLTQCSISGSKRECSRCPDGFSGDGMSGCEPLLSDILPSAGALTPGFAPGVTDYRIQVPLLVQRLALTPAAPAAARITLNGGELPESGVWTTPTLPLGEYTVELLLTAASGSVHAYKIIIERSGKQSTYIKASNTGLGDHLGIGIAMDGDTLVAGALFEDSASKGINSDGSSDAASESGAAYVFVRRGNSWEQEAYLKPDDTQREDHFGTSVAIWRDTIVVGAIRNNLLTPMAVQPRPGVAYVFTRTNGTWKQTARLVPATGADQDLFGYSCAVEENTLIVGAARDGGSGAAYVFAREGDTWHEVQKLKAKKPLMDGLFGSAVGVSGNTVLVASQEDGTELSGAGSATIFVRNEAMWTEQKRIIPTPGTEGGSFGYVAAIHGDTVMVGAPRVASLVSFASTSPGQVFVYERQAGEWPQTQVLSAIVPRTSDSFGSALALDESAALVGAPGDASGGRGVGADASRRDAAYSGAAYLFAREGSAWQPSAYLKPSNTDAYDSFGFSATLSGKQAVISAVWESSNATRINGDQDNNSATTAGAIYVFE